MPIPDRRYVLPISWLAGLLLLLIFSACSGTAATPTPAVPAGETTPGLSPNAREGETLFNGNCAVCHGQKASGSEVGPPLVHEVYEPGHHRDFAFQNAVKNGVPSHHWTFGDMAALPHLSEGEVERIICYVRELQRAAGIFEGDPC